jgi:hypothetical protein
MSSLRTSSEEIAFGLGNCGVLDMWS